MKYSEIVDCIVRDIAESSLKSGDSPQGIYQTFMQQLQKDVFGQLSADVIDLRTTLEKIATTTSNLEEGRTFATVAHEMARMAREALTRNFGNFRGQ